MVAKLEGAGLKVEAAKAHQLQTALQNSQSASCDDLENTAGSANELAEKLQADGHLEVADDVQKLADAIARSEADGCSTGELALGMIIGVTAGAFVCLCLVVGVCVFVIKRRKTPQDVEGARDKPPAEVEFANPVFGYKKDLEGPDEPVSHELEPLSPKKGKKDNLDEDLKIVTI